jgi:GT2 family glycosyltransferase
LGKLGTDFSKGKLKAATAHPIEVLQMPKTKKMRICLAIPTYNREEVLVQTLQSALRLNPRPDELMVVDQTQGHEEVTRRFLERLERRGRLRLIRQETPNLPMARNRALRETKCDIVIFIDDDVILPKDFLKKHSANFKDPEVDAVAGKVRQEDMSGFPRPSRGLKWPKLLDPLYFSVDGDRRVEGIATFRGCNHSVRTGKILELGGYDENFIGNAVGEENDLALRLWKSGGKIVFDPEAVLFHLVSPSGGCRVHGVRKKMPEWVVYFSNNYFAFRHYFPSAIFWYLTLWGSFWDYAFRKANREHPWKLPWAVLSYVYAWLRAGWKAYQRGKHESLPLGRQGHRDLNAFDRGRIFQKLAGIFGK